MPDNLKFMILLKPSEMHEIIIRDAIPSINPIMLNKVEKEMKPKLFFDHKCRKAIRVVRFIYLLGAMRFLRSFSNLSFKPLAPQKCKRKTF